MEREGREGGVRSWAEAHNQRSEGKSPILCTIFPKDKEQLSEKGSVLTVHGNGGTLTQMHKKL